MKTKGVRWGVAIGGGFLGEVAQIAAAFLWVAIYSYVLNPGQPMAVYQQHAEASGPWVSIIAGSVIFYFASRWMARSVPTAMALFATFVVIDVTLFVLADVALSATYLALSAASFLTKLLACFLGGRHGESRSHAAVA